MLSFWSHIHIHFVILIFIYILFTHQQMHFLLNLEKFKFT